jgi:hypothetical protein
MTRTLTTLIVAGALALVTPALADYSDSTPGFRHSGGYSGGTIHPAPKAPTSVYTGLDWNRDGTYAAHPGVPLTAAELLAQQNANRAWVVRENRAYVEQGGWDAPVLPVRVHAGGGHPGLGDAFGEGKQMGSNGGE